MSRDQRVQDNHALIAAQQLALEKGVPLYVYFQLTPLPLRAKEQYLFMLSGLEEVATELANLHIGFIMRQAEGAQGALQTVSEQNAGAVFFDFSPLKGARTRARTVATKVSLPVWVVDTHNIIQVWVASDKQEFAAHTFRRKVHKYFENYFKEPKAVEAHPHSPEHVSGLSFPKARAWADELPSNGTTVAAKPGTAAATSHLDTFLKERLKDYARGRNDPSHDFQSDLSPYLHYGQLSSLRVVLEAIKHTDIRPLLFDEARMATASTEPSVADGMNALFEEMIVRKELSDNFCFYNADYDSLDGAPDWAKKTLDDHRDDPREFMYTRQQWEAATTHDEAWNAAQRQLMRTGKLHGYLRMYWAKKMLEWSETPEQALADCIYLNDTYSIDGRDPNGYVGMLWSITGLHDRPWTQRNIFGAVRYMNAAGLKRKFDIQTYIDTWS